MLNSFTVLTPREFARLGHEYGLMWPQACANMRSESCNLLAPISSLYGIESHIVRVYWTRVLDTQIAVYTECKFRTHEVRKNCVKSFELISTTSKAYRVWTRAYLIRLIKEYRGGTNEQC